MNEASARTQLDQQKPALWTKKFVTLTLSSFLLFLNLQMLLSTFSMHIKSNLHGGDIQVSLSTSIFAATAIVARLMTGRWVKQLSRTGVLTIGLVIAALATVLAALPDSIMPLLLLRALYGIGFGIGSTIIPTLVSNIIPPKRMGEGIGYFGLSTSLAMSVGPAIGLSIMKQSGFSTLALVGAGAILFIFPMLVLSGSYVWRNKNRGEADGAEGSREQLVKTASSGVKVADGANGAKAESLTVGGSQQGEVMGSKSREAAGNEGKASGLVGSANTVKASTVSSASTAPRSIWRFPIWFPALLNVLISVTYSGILSFIAVYGEVRQLAQVGLFFMFNAVAILIVRPFAGKIFDRKGPLVVLVPAACFVIASIWVLSYADHMSLLILSALLYGIGFGSIQPTLQAWMLRSASKEEYGAVNGIFYNSTDVGVSLGAMVLGVIATLTSYSVMYRLSSLFMILFVLAMLMYIRKSKLVK